MKSTTTSYRNLTTAVQCAVGIAVTILPALADAQSGAVRRAPERVALRTRGCAEITAMPTMLATTPEGRSVVKLQRELGAAAQNAAKRGDGTSEIRGIVMAQKGVDSLMQVIVQQLGSGTATIIVREDSGDRSEFDRALMRSRIEATIREMQPRVAALAEAFGGAGGRMVPGHFAESGWIGLRISGSFFREATPSGLVTRYCDDYPVIEAVDPGSPAEKGGLQAGDTLLAFNNRDVLAHSIVHSETFVPGQQLRVKYRRVGRTREVPLVVAEPRAERFTYRAPALAPLACPGGNCERVMLRDSLVTFRVSPELSGTLQPSRVRAGAMSGTPPVPAVGMFMRDMNVTLVGGAQVALVGEELSQTLGLEQGLLVLRVLGGTPMADAGLRAGDVVRQINGAAARDLVALQRAFGVQGREVKLSVVSKGQAPRLVTVKW